MEVKCIIFASILLTICVTNIHSLKEGKENATEVEIVITEMKPVNRIELRTQNATSIVQETPTVIHTEIHQGNNLYIKPKFIIGSPFTSYKPGSKYNGANIVIGTPTIPQVPTIVVPPVITPPIIEDDISLPPPRFPVQLQPPYPCQNMMALKVPNDNISPPCSPIMIPISPNPPQLPRFPIVHIPVQPMVIPKPPELPPIVLPKLPIEVLVKRPLPDQPVIRPIPDQPVIVPPLCPTMVRCMPPRQALPSVPDIFSAIFEKFKNLLDLPNIIDFSSFLVSDERNEKELPPAPVFPTICAQGIIAARVVPNIVKNDEVKVILNPIFPSQSSFR